MLLKAYLGNLVDLLWRQFECECTEVVTESRFLATGCNRDGTSVDCPSNGNLALADTVLRSQF